PDVPFEAVLTGQAGKLRESRVQVEQLRGPTTTAGRAPGPGEDKRHARRSLPERVLSRDPLLPQMPAVVGPQNHNRVLLVSGFLQCIEDPADLAVHEADACQIPPDQWLPLAVLLEPLQPRLRK